MSDEQLAMSNEGYDALKKALERIALLERENRLLSARIKRQSMKREQLGTQISTYTHHGKRREN